MKATSTKNNWEHFSGSDWSSLLQHQPCFTDRYDWSKLDGGDWACLLRWHPDICGECDFSLLSASDWISVLSHRPELASKFEAVERNWDKNGEFDPLDMEVFAEFSRGN